MISKYYKIRIANIPMIDNVRMKLLKELNKELDLFGPIAKLTLIKNNESVNAYVRYQNDGLDHEKVVRYYTKFVILFHHNVLFFELLDNTADNSSTSTLKSYISESPLKNWSIVIYGLPCNHENLKDELLNEMRKDEHMFGPIEKLKIVNKIRSTILLAFLTYTDPSVYMRAIKYYNQMRPEFYGNRLYFEPAWNYNKEIFIDQEEEEHNYTDILPFRWDEMNDFDQRDIVILNVPNKPGIAEDLLAELERDEYLFGPIELLDLTMYRSRRSKMVNAWIRYVHREFHKDAILYYRRLWPTFHGFRLFFEPSHVRIDELNLHSFSDLLTNMNKKDTLLCSKSDSISISSSSSVAIIKDDTISLNSSNDRCNKIDSATQTDFEVLDKCDKSMQTK